MQVQLPKTFILEFLESPYWTTRAALADSHLEKCGLKFKSEDVRRFYRRNIVADTFAKKDSPESLRPDAAKERSELLVAALGALSDVIIRKGQNLPTSTTTSIELNELLLDEAARGYPDPRVLQKLVRAGADPNAVEADTQLTTLEKIARCYDVEAMLALIELGADANVKPAGTIERALFLIVRALKTKNHASRLLKAGARFDVADDRGRSILVHGIESNAPLPVIDVLIEGGADIAHADLRGRGVIHAAAHEGFADILRHLLRRGADPRLLDKERLQPLAVAMERRATACIEALAEFGVLITDVDPSTDRPFYERLRGLDTLAIKQLLGRAMPSELIIEAPAIDKEIAVLKEEIAAKILEGKTVGGADKERERIYHRVGTAFCKTTTENETGEKSTETTTSIYTFLEWLFRDCDRFGQPPLQTWKEVRRWFL